MIALTPAGVEKKTGVKVKTLANWRCLGVGPVHFKIGRLVRYSDAEVDKWLSEQTGRSAA
ncbi:hypothetical protein B7R22_16930 [Subtercola boreus]|uniref:Helix-turn-helix domain-containing protein n=1 Tax=Subtercola boreus TaxID=120213 RepID=A0A3E0VR55_9MICO|nr:hypothetical protein B7R22_16930 [Subtercola boreus]